MVDPHILLMQYIEVIKRQLREQMSEQVGIKERTKEDIIVQEPNLWQVVYYNDNVTPMDFVIKTLKFLIFIFNSLLSKIKNFFINFPKY